jgi:uncharacterized YccA/Bax inhibitor family protein
MKPEQKVNSIFLLLGILTGIFSKIFTVYITVVFGLLLYFVSLLALTRAVRVRKMTWYLSNSLTYFLVWLLVWIILFNQ